MWGRSRHLILSLAFSSSHFSFLINLSILLWGVIYACVAEAAPASAPLIRLNNRSAPCHPRPPAAPRGHGSGCRQESHMNHFPLWFFDLVFCGFELSSVTSNPFRQQRGDGAGQHPPAQLCHLPGPAWWQHQPQIRLQGNVCTCSFSCVCSRVGFLPVNIWSSQIVVSHLCSNKLVHRA